MRQLRDQSDEEIRELDVGRDALNGQGGITLRGLLIHPVFPGLGSWEAKLVYRGLNNFE